MIDYGFGVELDAIEPTDLEQMRRWRNDERIRKWCRQTDLIAPHEQEAWFLGCREKMFAIRHSGKLVGVAGLTSVDTVARRAEFSLYIGPQHWRKGLARAALKTLFRHGFDSLNLHLIWGETFDGNPALSLFKSLGMVVEGVRRDFYYKGGKYINASLISIKKDEFNY